MTDRGGASVTPYDDGPLIVRGDFALVTPDGEPIETGRRTIALCRCGKSASKPFCDGTHKAIGFRTGPPGDAGRTSPGPALPAAS